MPSLRRPAYPKLGQSPARADTGRHIRLPHRMRETRPHRRLRPVARCGVPHSNIVCSSLARCFQQSFAAGRLELLIAPQRAETPLVLPAIAPRWPSQFAGKLQAERAGRLAAEAQLSQVRASLVLGVAGPSADLALYQHAPLLDLVRLFGKEKADAAAAEAASSTRPLSQSSRPPSRAFSRGGTRRARTPTRARPDSPSASVSELGGTARSGLRLSANGRDDGDADLELASPRDGKDDQDGRRRLDDDEDSKMDGGTDEDAAAASRVMGSLDHDAALRAARLHNLELSRRLEGVTKREEALAEEARAATDAKARAMSFAAKLRAASSRASRAESAAEAAEARVDALTQHITKLMTHLEHEAGGKAKLHDKLRHAEAVIGRLKARNGKMAQANQERDRLVLDLKVSCHALQAGGAQLVGFSAVARCVVAAAASHCAVHGFPLRCCARRKVPRF